MPRNKPCGPLQGGWCVTQVTALILLTVACDDCGDKEKVKKVQVEPPVVQVPAGHQVELNARAFDKNGYTLIREDIEWNWDPEGSDMWVVTNLGMTATLELAEGADGPLIVVVTADGKSATATVVALPGAPSTDVAVVDPTLVPAVAHVWGTAQSSSDCREDGDARAFEYYGALWTNLVAGVCRSAAAVMSEKKALLYLSTPSTPTLWTVYLDQVGEAEPIDPNMNGNINGVPPGGTTIPDLTKPLELPVKVWIAVADEDVEEAEKDARQDVGTVNRVFERNRVGVHLAADYEVVTNPDEAGKSCFDYEAPTPVEPKWLNVYYVGWATGMPQGESCGYRTATSDPLPTCESTTPKPDEFAYIYIFWKRRTGTTLVHELGHALGLQSPYVPEGGHTGDGTTQFVEGFTSNNVMWTSLDADIALSRESFSLGQVFRMVIGEYSWLNRSVRSGPTENCCLEPSMCPKLALDLKDLDWPE